MTGITPTHAIERPETPEEDAARMESLRLTRLRSRMACLERVVPPHSFEAFFLRRRAEALDAYDMRLVERLLWHYRRALPRHLAPKLNPDDPIVRELPQLERAA